MNLYKITCVGLTDSIRIIHGVAYVVAENSDDAYKMLRKHLDDKKLGFTEERQMRKIELIAEDTSYPECGYRLLLAEHRCP